MAEEIKAEVQFDIADLKDAIDDLGGSVQEFIEAFSSEFIEKVDKGSNALKESFKGTSEAAKDMSKEIKSSAEEQEKQLLSLSQKYDNWLDDLKKKGGIGGAIAEGMPQQIAGIQTGVQQFKQSILSELPFGGIVGLALLGAMRPQEVFAAGAQASRMFEQTGSVARRQMQMVGADIRRVGVALGKGPTGMAGEFSAAAAAFAQGGVDIKDVLEQKFDQPIKHSRGTLLETSVALDSLFKQAAGTAARQMTTMIRDFNLSAKESANVIAAIGLSARDSGTSVQAFSESVIRSATALRTQRVDITEVAQAQLKFQQILETGMPGTKEQFRAGYAERAIGQVTQGLANMNVGLSAVIGERISQGTNEPVTGLQAYYLMREGLGGKGQLSETEQGYFAKSLKELGDLAAEGGRTESEQRFFLEKMGFGFEGAKAIQSMREELKDTGGDQIKMQKIVASHSEELKNAFVDRAAEQTDLMKSLIKIQDGVAKIGLGILKATISGFQIIHSGIMLGINRLTRGSDEERQVYERMLGESVKSASIAQDVTYKGIREAFQGVEIGGKSVLGAGGMFSGTSEEEIRKQVRKEAGLTREIGGEAYTPAEAKDIQKRAQQLQEQRTSQELSTLLESAGLRGPKAAGIGMPGPIYKELYQAGKGGEEEFRETAERLKAEGKLPTRAAAFIPEMGVVAEKTAARTTMTDSLGRKLTLEMASTVKIVGEESATKGQAE